MKIGIDAIWFHDGPPSGMRVSQNLNRALLEYDQVNEYFFFLNEKHKSKGFPYEQPNRVRCIDVWAGNNLISNAIVVPWKANKLDLDVMAFLNFVSPFSGNKENQERELKVTSCPLNL